MVPTGSPSVRRSLVAVSNGVDGSGVAVTIVRRSRSIAIRPDRHPSPEFAAVTFATVTFVVLAALLALSVATYRTTDRTPALPSGETDSPRRSRGIDGVSAGGLLVNVALTHGLLGAILVAGVVATGVPASVLGLGIGPDALARHMAVGLALGGVLYVGNEGAMRGLALFGVEYEAELRTALTPDSTGGWFALLGFALPVVAGFEELLFRASLIGALAAGFGVPVVVLAAFSSIAFAVGHGLQGPGGVAVAGLLGVALAGAFVVTGSLVVVVAAHYAINALEFLVRAGR